LLLVQLLDVVVSLYKFWMSSYKSHSCHTITFRLLTVFFHFYKMYFWVSETKKPYTEWHQELFPSEQFT
jgi:hypothetical protein